jgi:phospholipid-binding lipoprotein MlaA
MTGMLAFAMAGCATPPPADDPDAVADFKQLNDPLEPTNRVFYKVNLVLDDAIMKPVAKAYRFAVPEPVRTSVHNLFDNASAPLRLAGPAIPRCAS